MAGDFAGRLLAWFDQHGRKDLPWQRDKTPYRVWISEIMLQQTQVTTVIPYFEKFMQRFPTIDTLARASQDEVLHQWTGLGYYARARNLHKTAKQVMTGYNGELPVDATTLESLPGIGRSTAAAIIALCTGQRASILDGNVKRVLARAFAVEGWPGSSATLKELWRHAERLTPDKRVADYTQAIMDLGAMVCTRSSPACHSCPFNDLCEARLNAAIEMYPGKKPRKSLPVRATTMLIVESDGEFLLEKRPATGVWGGLWSFPELSGTDPGPFLQDHGLNPTGQEAIEPFRHTFTHFHLDITPVKVSVTPVTDISEADRFCWYDPARPTELGLSNPVTRLLKSLHQG